MADPGKLESLEIVRLESLVRDLMNVASSVDVLPFVSALKWNDEGLIPAIVQDADNGEVLMMAWMDEPRLERHGCDRADAFLLPFAADALAQGGDIGPCSACRVGLARLRWRRALDQGTPGWRRVPRGLPLVLLPAGGR